MSLRHVQESPCLESYVQDASDAAYSGTKLGDLEQAILEEYHRATIED
jgi:hypothetical protein